MRFPTLLLLAFVTSVLGQSFDPVLGQFLDPDQSGETWRIGERKKIVFNTTLRHYTIGLWQQAPPAAAVLGDIAFRILDAKGWVREFDWEVQAYGLDLSVSNVAYFWLFEGTDGNQGNQTLRHISSATFTIAERDPAGGPSTAAGREPTKTVVLSRAAPAGPSMTSTTTSTAGTPGGSGATRTRTKGGPASTGDDKATQTGDEADGGGGGDGGGLPVGAQAGIGVGVGVFGISCIVCAAMLQRHLRTRRKALAAARESTMAQQQPPAYFHGSPSVVSPVSPVRSPAKSTAGFYVNPKPVEIA